MSKILHGDGSFKFTAAISGNDLIVENVTCTWFGGDDDKEDNGLTASGVVTKGHPNLLGCALPMDGFHHAATNGSPIPKLKWKTLVTVTNRANNQTKSFELIDLGPSKFAPSHAAIDLTKAAFKALGGNPKDGTMKVDYRIVGGAKGINSAVNSVSLVTSLTFEPTNEAAEELTEETGDTATVSIADTGHGSNNPTPKPVIKQFIASPNHSSRNGTKIDTIVLHCTESATAQSAINEFLNPNGRQVSAHYVVDTNGDIYQMVQDSQRANHCKGANANSIGIEHAGTGKNPLTSAQQAATAKLIKWLMQQYDIPISKIFGHDFTPNRATSTSCPDALFGKKHEQQTISQWLNSHVV